MHFQPHCNLVHLRKNLHERIYLFIIILYHLEHHLERIDLFCLPVP